MKSTEQKNHRKVAFTKMHGAGNDYVYIDATDVTPENPEALARAVSDRHFGIGSDGLVLIMSSDNADFRMRMFNADGTEAEMCGNATRCIGKYVYDRGLTDKIELTLETKGGIKHLTLHLSEGEVESVTVDMGKPVLIPADVPARSANPEMKVNENERIGGRDYRITAVSMGNPHAVIFADILSDKLVLKEGPHIERSDVFPNKTNVEFARVIDRHNIEMRVWERGTGETLACGTGACATAVAGVLNGLTERDVTLHLRGGKLQICWDSSTGHVLMTGPAAFICDGVYYRAFDEEEIES